MELIKTAIKVGNSAGVLLPKQYLNSQVRIILEPLNIEKDVLEILMEENLLTKVLGIYLVGSYARKEQTIESDIDILVITSDTNKTIKKEKYELICISKKELETQLTKNILPLLPMLKEAKPIINSDLIKTYSNTQINKKNLKWHIDTTKSALQVINKDVKLSKELKEENTSDEIAYSLILRLRTLNIIDNIIKNKLPTKKDFLKLIKTTTSSLSAYESYLRAKKNQKTKNTLPIKEAEKLTILITNKIKTLEKWLKEKRD